MLLILCQLTIDFFCFIIYDQAEHIFDQNATIKETDEDEDDLASEMVNVEPGIDLSFNFIRISPC